MCKQYKFLSIYIAESKRLEGLHLVFTPIRVPGSRCIILYIKHCIIRNNKEFAYKALHNTEYMQSVLIIWCFICKIGLELDCA